MISTAISSVICIPIDCPYLFNVPLSMPKTIKYRVYDVASVNTFDAFRAQKMHTVLPSEVWLGKAGQQIMELVYPNKDTDIKATTYEAKLQDGSILPSFI